MTRLARILSKISQITWRAGITRYERVGGAPRNPDDLIGSFRVQYADLLRDENRELYICLRGERPEAIRRVARDGFISVPSSHCWGGATFKSFIRFATKRKGNRIGPDFRPCRSRYRKPIMAKRARLAGEHRFEWRPSKRFWIRDICDRPRWKSCSLTILMAMPPAASGRKYPN